MILVLFYIFFTIYWEFLTTLSGCLKAFNIATFMELSRTLCETNIIPDNWKSAVNTKQPYICVQPKPDFVVV